jgi:predicted FMN-binding regulatory protein PaiB
MRVLIRLYGGKAGFRVFWRRGKWKLSQNRSEQDRSGVARGLAESNTPEGLMMKAIAEQRIDLQTQFGGIAIG